MCLQSECLCIFAHSISVSFLLDREKSVFRFQKKIVQSAVKVDVHFCTNDCGVIGADQEDGEMSILGKLGSLKKTDPVKAFEALPEIDREMIAKIVRDPNRYSEEAMVEVIRDKARLREKCPDGKVRFIVPVDSMIPFPSGYRDNLCVKSMPALLFAIYRGEYKVASLLFRSEEYGAPEKMQPLVTYMLEYGPENDPFCYPDEVHTDQIRLTDRHENDRLYGFVLADLCKAGKHMNQQFAYRFLKKYYGEAESGWFRCNHGIVPYEAPGTVNPLTGMVFCSEPPETNALTIYIKLLDYIRRTDEEFFRKFVDAGVFAELFAKSCFLMEDENRRENLKLIRRMYVPEIADAEKVWSEAALVATGNMGEVALVGLPRVSYPQFSRDWAYVTGKPLPFRIGYVDLEKLKFEDDDRIPFGWDSCMKEDGTISGNFLQMLIRGADRVEYEGDRGRYQVDLEYLLDNGGEELALMALQKGFIRRQDVERALKHLKEKKKSFLVPALLLKKHGEW